MSFDGMLSRRGALGPPARVGKGGRASLMIQFGSRIVQPNGLETQLVILEEAER